MAKCIEHINPDNISGVYNPDSDSVTLFTDNIPPGQALAVFLHEAGEHAGLQQMLGDQKYRQLQANFDRMLLEDNPHVRAAAERVPTDTPAEHVGSERLAYLIEGVANRQVSYENDAKERRFLGKAKTLARQVVAAVRAWAYSALPAWATKSVKLGEDDFMGLAVRAARGWGDGDAAGILNTTGGSPTALPENAGVRLSRNGEGDDTAKNDGGGSNGASVAPTAVSPAGNNTRPSADRLSRENAGKGAVENGAPDIRSDEQGLKFSRKPPSDTKQDSTSKAPLSEGLSNSTLWAEADADAKDSPSFRAKIWSAIQRKATEVAKNGGLGGLTMRQLIEIGEKHLPSMERYADRVDQMMMKRNARMDQAQKLGTFWSKLDKATNRRVSWLMHESTKDAIDASLDELPPSEVVIMGGMDAVRGVDPSIEGGIVPEGVRVPATAENMAALRARRLAANKRFKGQAGTGLDKRIVARYQGVRVPATAENMAALRARRLAANKRFKGQAGTGLDKRIVMRYQAEEKAMRGAMKRDEARIKSYPRLRQHFLNLPENAQQTYTLARDMHTKRLAESRAALLAMVERETAEMSEHQQKQAMAAIRLDFERAIAEGIYFPLGRAGDYFVRYERSTGQARETYRPKSSGQAIHSAVGPASATWATAEAAMRSATSRADLIGKRVEAVAEGNGYVLQDKGTETVFERFDSALEAEQHATKLREDTSGKVQDVKHGRLSKTKSDDAVGVGEFASGVLGILKDAKVQDAVRDEVYQHYLQFLPSLSMRKQFIHRKKTPGYQDDALNVFARAMLHQAHQISKLEAAADLREILDDVAGEARALEGGYNPETGEAADSVLAGNLREELKLRHDWVMNPTNAPWTSWTSSAGFLWYLGASPAAALVNLSQTVAVAYPVLGAEFGWKESAAALKDAAKLLDGKGLYRESKKVFTRNDAPEVDLVLKREGLTEQENKAFADWQELGVHDVTNAHMLAGIGDVDSIASSVGYQKAMGKVAHFFQTAEMLNREVTLLAGYRLAKEAGQSHDQAVRSAAKVTWDSHFDYSNHNRARFMQSDGAKLFLMFKSYGQHMMFHMVRNAYKAGKGDKQATRILMGTLTATALMGGVTALPLGVTTAAPAGYAFLRSKYGEFAANVTAAAGVVLLFGMMAAEDEDEPFEFGAEVRKALREMGGEPLESVVMDGVINAFTGVDLSNRISLGDILVRAPNRELEGRDAATYWIEQLAGPVVGIATKQVTAAHMASEGHWWRGIETSLPKFIADPMKAMRYANEGALNMKGAPVKDVDLLSVFGDDLSAWDVFMRMNGFSPQELSRQYRQNNDDKNAENALKKRRGRLMQAYYVAYMARDQGEMRDVFQELRAFGRKNPALGVDAKSVQASLNARIRAQKQAKNGIYMSARYREAVE